MENEISKGNPASAPPPATSGQSPPQADLLSDVLPGGILDSVLARPDHAKLDSAAKELHDKLRDDVKKMRAVIANPKYELRYSYDPQPSTIPRLLVLVENERYKANAVLRYSLGVHWKIADSEESTRDAAWKAYVHEPEDYDQVLGDFIPADFRTEAWTWVAESRFDKGIYLTAADDWPVYRLRLQFRRGRKLLGVPTGIPALDIALRGLRGLTYLGGGPGVGKTSLALFMAVHALRAYANLAVLFYSLDMPKTVLYDRLFCQEAGLEYADLIADTPSPENKRKFEEAEARLQKDVLPRLRILEHIMTAANQSVADAIWHDAWQLLDSANGVLIVVDYFQLLPVDAKISSTLDADFDRVRSLQQVQERSRTNAHPEGFPILAISEVRKGEAGRTEISVGDLMGSARLGYSAESVLLLELSSEDMPNNVVAVGLKIAKGRDGAVRSTIDLLFEYTRYRFREAPPAQRTKATPIKKTATKPAKEKIDPFAGTEKS